MKIPGAIDGMHSEQTSFCFDIEVNYKRNGSIPKFISKENSVNLRFN